MAEVIRFDLHRDRERATPSATEFEPSVQVEDEEVTGSTQDKNQYVSPSRLYPLQDSASTTLQPALKLIAEAKEHLSGAIQSIEEGDRVASELNMQHLKPIIAELFCFRNFGDGFATVISSVFYSIVNYGHLEFTSDQILMVNLAIKKIYEDPFIDYDRALELVDGLENSGFVVEPPEFEILADILDGKSLR